MKKLREFASTMFVYRFSNVYIEHNREVRLEKTLKGYINIENSR